MDIERLQFLARLPLLLNSSLDSKTVIARALQELQSQLDAEASTLFLLGSSAKELTFWALEGGDSDRLSGKKMPAGKGIVGWVIEHQESQLVADTKNDPRFFSDIDTEGGFVTRNMVCVPLISGGRKPRGAIQVLNKKGDATFSPDDLEFVEQFGNQVALAVENTVLFETLKLKNVKLEKLERRKNEVIAVITHEFKTPLAILQGTADLLASGLIKEQEKQKEIADTLVKGVQRLTRLIEEVKNVSLTTERELEVNKTAVSLPELFESVRMQFEAPLEIRKLNFSSEIAKGAESVLADDVLLMVVLKNLVSNAIRFTDDGGQIKLAAERSSGFVEISVTDTGIGIDESEQALIFEKFYEVSDAMVHSSGQYEFKSCGLGLGLGTAKGILQAHGAGIEVESKVGEGSRFFFRLPF